MREEVRELGRQQIAPIHERMREVKYLQAEHKPIIERVNIDLHAYWLFGYKWPGILWFCLW